MISAASPSGRCWTFDARADGYIKAEAVNALVLKRLEDALRDGDPIRAIIRGTSVNSDGWTPGIASPNASAQALAIKRAYNRAGIVNLGETAYLECHGTGTLAGDPIECRAASSVFSPFRFDDSPLRIGSVKSNIGHSEPAAGISGILKAVLACENGVIPGNPTFRIPNPLIDFQGAKLLPPKVSEPWPQGMIRRASVNSFGYGGSNAHVVVEHPSVLLSGWQPTQISSYDQPGLDLLDDNDEDEERRLLVFSANDNTSLKSYIKQLIRHLANPAVRIKSADLARTLGERRTRHFHRAFVISKGVKFKEHQVVYSKPRTTNCVGFVFTGQGAQWPLMGKKLMQDFSVARATIEKLDNILRGMPNPPSWSLVKELTEPRSDEHFRQPEISQPLVTALQLGIIAVLKHWHLTPSAVVGHSSGEIAAAVSAGILSQEEGIKVAYLRGKAAKDIQEKQEKLLVNGTVSVDQEPRLVPNSKKQRYGMLVVGLGHDDGALECLKLFPGVSVACRNSPKSVTLAGETEDLDKLRDMLKREDHFARMLKVDLAYHSKHMRDIAVRYRGLLLKSCPELGGREAASPVRLFSTVRGAFYEAACDVEYWVANMVSPVLFSDGATALIRDGGIDHLIEIGPNATLAGPIKQIMEAVGDASQIEYSGTVSRIADSTGSLYNLAGKLLVSGVDININRVNAVDNTSSRVVVDLPRYQWNHSVKYWHESLASRDWRYRRFPVHDLLGTKVLGTSWHAPTWKRVLRLGNVPWIKDHILGTDIVFPGAGYIAMACEAMYQVAKSTRIELYSGSDSVRDASYRLRDVRLLLALVLEEEVDHHVYLFLSTMPGQKNTWFQFKISSLRDDSWTEHCTGFIRIDPAAKPTSSPIQPLKYATSIRHWHRSMQKVGFNFGPWFQNVTDIESVPGQRKARARLSLVSKISTSNESKYPIHPTIFDSFFQSCMPSLYQGYRTAINMVLVPHLIDEITITSPKETSPSGIAVTSAVFTTGRKDKTQNYAANATIYDEANGTQISSIKGLHFTELNISQKSVDAAPLIMTLDWKPDISLLRYGDNIRLPTPFAEGGADMSTVLDLPRTAASILSLIQHKFAMPSVLDLDMSEDKDDGCSCQQDEDPSSIKNLSLRRYVYASKVGNSMVKAQKRLKSLSAAEFHLYDATETTTAQVPFQNEGGFDFVILRLPAFCAGEVETAVSNARGSLRNGGFLVVIQAHSSSTEEPDSAPGRWQKELRDGVLGSAGLTLMVDAPLDMFGSIHLYSYREHIACKTERVLNFSIVKLSQDISQLRSLTSALEGYGWQGAVISASESRHLSSDNALLLIDDPRSPWLLNMTDSDWEHLHSIISSERKLLWLTSGSQMKVTSPSNAVVYGLARTLRAENPTLTLKILDVSSLDSKCIPSLIKRVIESIEDPIQHLENEYCERDGVLYVSRVRLDEALRQVAREVQSGPPVRDMWLRNNEKTVRMHSERVGAMDSLQFNQVDELDVLPPGHVEVEIKAAGLNYKVCDSMPTTCINKRQEAKIILALGHCEHTWHRTRKRVSPGPRRRRRNQPSRQQRSIIPQRGQSSSSQQGLFRESRPVTGGGCVLDPRLDLVRGSRDDVYCVFYRRVRSDGCRKPQARTVDFGPLGHGGSRHRVPTSVPVPRRRSLCDCGEQ